MIIVINVTVSGLVAKLKESEIWSFRVSEAVSNSKVPMRRTRQTTAIMLKSCPPIPAKISVKGKVLEVLNNSSSITG